MCKRSDENLRPATHSRGCSILQGRCCVAYIISLTVFGASHVEIVGFNAQRLPGSKICRIALARILHWKLVCVLRMKTLNAWVYKLNGHDRWFLQKPLFCSPAVLQRTCKPSFWGGHAASHQAQPVRSQESEASAHKKRDIGPTRYRGQRVSIEDACARVYVVLCMRSQLRLTTATE